MSKLSMIKKMSECIKILHNNGIIQYDIKPENILINTPDYININTADIICVPYCIPSVISFFATSLSAAMVQDIILIQPLN